MIKPRYVHLAEQEDKNKGLTGKHLIMVLCISQQKTNF